jgi:hypothetical protein
LVSTWVAKPEVHAEVRVPRKTVRKTLVANDDNYARSEGSGRSPSEARRGSSKHGDVRLTPEAKP